MHGERWARGDYKPKPACYTLSHLENDRDVSTYSGGKRLLLRAQLVCFVLAFKKNTVIDAQRMRLAARILVTVVLGMRQNIVIV